MPAFTAQQVASFARTTQGAQARDVYPVPAATSYTISGTRAVGDVDEVFVLRRGHRISRIFMYAEDGLADANGNVSFGVIDGELGGNPSTTAADTAAERRVARDGALSLNSVDVSDSVSQVHEDAEMFFDVDDNADRAVGFKWTAARAAATAKTVRVVIEVSVAPNTE